MNLQQLKVFVLAVRLQKLYLVAEKLGIRQPTVTFHLNKLQEELGVPLFATKSYHVIRLTEAGQALFHYASRIASLSDEIEATIGDFRQLRGARLAIGSTHTPATYLLPPYLAELKADFPDLSVLLDVKPASVITDKIKRFELDAGIVTRVDPDDPELLIQPLRRDDLIVVFPPAHPFAAIESLKPDDLSRRPFVAHEVASFSRQLIDEWAAKQRVSLEVAMEVSGSEAMKAAVKHGIGFALLSESVVRHELDAGELSGRAIPEWTFPRRFYLIRSRNKLISPAMQLFIDRVAAKLK